MTETEAAAIRTAFAQQGELSAALEVRRLFPAISGNAQARRIVQMIVGWQPVPQPEHPRLKEPRPQAR